MTPKHLMLLLLWWIIVGAGLTVSEGQKRFIIGVGMLATVYAALLGLLTWELL